MIPPQNLASNSLWNRPQFTYIEHRIAGESRKDRSGFRPLFDWHDQQIPLIRGSLRLGRHGRMTIIIVSHLLSPKPVYERNEKISHINVVKRWKGGILLISNEEIRLIQRFAEAIFPGAVEARADVFIVRDMQSNPFMIEMYRKGFAEWEKGAQEQYRLSLRQLDREQLHQLLVRYENTPFFKFLRNHTLEGIFSDPIYGGNYQAYGWRLVGFAGAAFHPPETLDHPEPPTVYYSLGGIPYEET
jgi:gluconate 2-dehydrogenase gamma chain